MYETRSSVSRPSCPWPVFFQRKKVERGGLPRSVRASSLESSHSSAMRKKVRSAGPDRRSGSACGLAAFLGAVRAAERDTARCRTFSTKQDYIVLIVQCRTKVKCRGRFANVLHENQTTADSRPRASLAQWSPCREDKAATSTT